MTVAEALLTATARLTEAGVETPRLDAALLLAWTLKRRREDLAREPEFALPEREEIIFRKAVALRAERRPVAYLTGEWWFYGRSFKINRAGLIPRPETEMLIDAARERLAGREAPRLADIGTGTGCLAVTLACELPQAEIFATDIYGDALKLAAKNVRRHGVTDRVTLLHGSLLAPLPADGLFDAIVSNPPYIPETDLSDLQPEVRDYEPRLALSGEPDAVGPDGTLLHRAILSQSLPRLRPGGWVFLEVGQGQAQTVAAHAASLGYQTAIRTDFADIERVVLAQKPS